MYVKAVIYVSSFVIHYKLRALTTNQNLLIESNYAGRNVIRKKLKSAFKIIKFLVA